MKEIAPGKKIVDICAFGDKTITDLLAGVYKTGNVEKGVAFPTSISVNNCAGHFSPLPGDPAALEDGDLVKVYVFHVIDTHFYCKNNCDHFFVLKI